MKRLIAFFLFTLMLSPITGSLTLDNKSENSKWFTVDPYQQSWHPIGSTFEVPQQLEPTWASDDTPWWESSSLDKNNQADETIKRK